MLYTSSRLLAAYSPLKEQFFLILDSAVDCGNTMVHWSKGILNSFDCSYTNGFTEGVNNKIKVLKRNAYGYRNFPRFRNRILHIVIQCKMEQLNATPFVFPFWATPTIDRKPVVRNSSGMGSIVIKVGQNAYPASVFYLPLSQKE